MQQAQAQASRAGRRHANSANSVTAAIQWLFISPTLILLIALNIFPLFYSLYLSFTDYSAIAKEAPDLGRFQNYATSAQRPTDVDVLLPLPGALPFFPSACRPSSALAWPCCCKEQFRGSGLFTTLILVPMMLSPVVVGLFWKLIFNPSYGIFNYLIGFRNPATAPDWLASAKTALWAVVIVDVWMWTPVCDAALPVRSARPFRTISTRPPPSTAPVRGCSSGASPCRR